jgi:hypothetical protein
MKCPHCGNDTTKEIESFDEFWRVALDKGLASDDEEGRTALMLYLGYAAGSLSKDERRAQVAKLVRDGELRVGYLKALRDSLDEIILGNIVERAKEHGTRAREVR